VSAEADGTPAAAIARLDPAWLESIADGITLVPLRIQPARLQRAPDGAHDLFLRTDVGRFMSSLFRPPDGAVREDGVPLDRSLHIDDVFNGRYMVCRDQVRFRPSDGSDPRTNGRVYTVMVPSCVRAAEELPLHLIRRHQI